MLDKKSKNNPELKRTTIWVFTKIHVELQKILMDQQISYSQWVRNKEIEEVEKAFKGNQAELQKGSDIQG